MRKISTSAGGRSRQRIITAVTELLDERDDAERVTITDVVTAAGLTRPTFYAAFADLPTSFAAAALSRLGAAFDGLGLDPGIPPETRSESMGTAFEAILIRLSEHSEFFGRVLRGPGGPIVHAQIVEFIATRLRESSPVSGALAQGRMPLEMSSSAIAAGVVWSMMRWLDEEPRRDIAAVAVELRDFVESSVLGGLGRTDAATAVEQ